MDEKPKISAQDLLDKSEEEVRELGKREANKLLRDLKIITAIMLGKKSNKELAQVMDTDKSYMSKKIKELEQKGLVHRRGQGKDTQYEVNEFNVMRFLTSKVVLKWGKKKEEVENGKGN